MEKRSGRSPSLMDDAGVIEQDPNYLSTLDALYEGRRASEITRGSERRAASAESRRCSEPATLRRPPAAPPSPSLAHLTKDEIHILNSVFSRMENFEVQESARISSLQRDVAEFEEYVRQQSAAIKSRLKHVDLRLCRLCFNTKFADGIGRVCNDCHRRVCQRCGAFTRSRWDAKKNKLVKGRWRCTLCQMRWELAAASGVWFNGGHVQPPATDSIRQKLSDVNVVTSDWASADVEQSDSSVHRGRASGNTTDPGIHYGHAARGHLSRQSSRETETFSRSCSIGGKQYARRRVSSAGDSVVEVLEDEEDLDVDDELFLRERQKCRQERLLMHQKKVRRKGPRRTSVGTSTEEDSLLGSDSPVNCPWHGQKKRRSVEQVLSIQVPNVRAPGRREPQPIKESSASYRNSPPTAPRHPSHGEARSLPPTQRRRSSVGRVNSDPVLLSKAASQKYSECEQNPNENRSEKHPKNLSDGEQSAQGSTARGTISPTGHRLKVPIKLSPRRRRKSAEIPNLRPPNGPDRRVSDPGASAIPRRSSSGAAAAGAGSEAFLSAHLINPFLLDSIHAASGAATSSSHRLSLLASDSTGQETTAVPVYLKDYDSSVPGSIQIVPLIITKDGSVDSSLDGEFLADIQRRLSVTSQASSCRRSLDEKRNSDGSVSQGNARSLCGQESETPLKPMKMLRRSSSTHNFRVVLKRDLKDPSCRTGGLGMRVVGGKLRHDGKLGAFVTHVIKGGAADLAGIAEGDQVLEWDGSSLEDATFEEAQQLLARSGDTVQLLIMHTSSSGLEKREVTQRRGSTTQAKDKGKEEEKPEGDRGRRMSEHRMERAKERAMRVENWLTDSKEEERRWGDGREVTGRLQLKMWYDARASALSVTVLRAQNLAVRPGPERQVPHTYAKLYLLQDKSISEVMMTMTVQNSKEPEWNKTYSLHGLGPDKVRNTTVLVVVWDYFPCKEDVFVGEVLLDLATADFQDNPLWYPLEAHDENCGRLPMPERKSGETGPTKGETGPVAVGSGGEEDATSAYGSLPLLPATPAYDKAKELLGKRGSHFLSRVSKDLTYSAPSLVKLSAVKSLSNSDMRRLGGEEVTAPDADDGKKKGLLSRVGKLRTMKRRMSEVALKVGTILQDKRHPLSPDLSKESKPLSTGLRRHSMTEPSIADKLGSSSLSRKSQQLQTMNNQSSGMGAGSSTSDNEEDFDRCSSYIRPPPDGHDITSMLGPAQLPPKTGADTLCQGDIKLGFMISKGQLEVDVMCAKSLRLGGSDQPPDTYVKTCLLGNGKRLQKKKTRLVKGTTDPCYMHKLKYSACNVHGRCMQLLIKEKTGNLDRNQVLGEVVVRLDSLDLSSSTTGWYKLFRVSSTQWGSCESINGGF